MDLAIKQRLVGAIILVALGVIFIPVLLDGTGHKSRFGRSMKIPSRPEIREIRPPAQQLLDSFTSVETGIEKNEVPRVDRKYRQQSAAQNAKADNKPAIVTPEPDHQSTTIHAWALQVGNYSSQSNALAMRDKLRAKGYPAYISEHISTSSHVFRVRIGPEIEQSSAIKLKDRLERKEKLTGFVVKHP